MWLKVWKTYRGGRVEDFIHYDTSDTTEERKHLAESWAERSLGGHNYGWTVYWENVDRPTEEWIKNEKEVIETKIFYLKDYLRILNKEK